tara:strand:- start:11171 stop:11623 length:453 start_codon:yes stop_codon:yes gene_type:complete
MKFEKPFHIKLQPYYVISEPTTEEESVERDLTTQELGGLTSIRGERESQEDIMVRSGGRMDWNLFNESNGHKPSVNIQLMRLWTCQMVIQMVNNKSYVNEIDDEPKFDITDEEREIFEGIMHKLTEGLNDCLEKSAESMVTNKKIKKVEL